MSERPQFVRRVYGRPVPDEKGTFCFPVEPEPYALPYPGARLRWALEVIGWNINQFAWRMDMDEGTVRQMLGGRRFIPDAMGIGIETLAQIHLTFPKPVGWVEKRSHPQKTVDDLS